MTRRLLLVTIASSLTPRDLIREPCTTSRRRQAEPSGCVGNETEGCDFGSRTRSNGPGQDSARFSPLIHSDPSHAKAVFSVDVRPVELTPLTHATEASAFHPSGFSQLSASFQPSIIECCRFVHDPPTIKIFHLGYGIGSETEKDDWGGHKQTRRSCYRTGGSSPSRLRTARTMSACRMRCSPTRMAETPA